jgi:hypothetical protein
MRAQFSDSLSKRVPIDRVSIMQKIFRCGVPGESLGDLACCPFGSRFGGNVEMNHPTPLMGEHDEDKQEAKGRRGYDKEICRSQLVDVIVEERRANSEMAACSCFRTYGETNGMRKPGCRLPEKEFCRL